jgi:transposase
LNKEPRKSTAFCHYPSKNYPLDPKLPLIRVLWHDGQRMCLFSKRLERGRFIWPSTSPGDDADRSVTITSAQLGYLLEGIDWRPPQRRVKCRDEFSMT